VLESLTDLVTDSPVTYLVVAGLVALDAVFPIAPSETLIVPGGVLAADGDLSAPALVLGQSLSFTLATSVAVAPL
jgi:membrane protein DedA with SNARE-associated domain